VIYICTVHFNTTKWINRQLYFINKNINSDYRILGCLPYGYSNSKFYVSSYYNPNSIISYNHADKLNYLAKIVSMEANPDDIIIFLDGDAFPIAKIDDYIIDK